MPKAFALLINGRQFMVAAPAEQPLLWALRDNLGLTGTKFGCGAGLCGACTVHVDGVAMRSCQLQVGHLEGKHITTIEGLAAGSGTGDSRTPHPVQQVWLELGVAQCGYCQVGQIMSATALLASNPHPSDEEIDSSMSGNICRCGTYNTIRKAIHESARRMAEGKPRHAIPAGSGGQR